MLAISPGNAISLNIPAQRCLRIINSKGGQVVDTWAFTMNDFGQFLSMEHSRSALYKLWFEPGDTLVSNHFEPLLSIVEDTSPGIHDTLHAACSPGSYQFYGQSRDHPNCQNNLIAELCSRGVELQTIPCPWNLFEHAYVQNMRLKDAPASAGKGDYIELRAEQDLLLVCSACPSMVGSINGVAPRGASVLML